jgi:hypothetical protein
MPTVSRRVRKSLLGMLFEGNYGILLEGVRGANPPKIRFLAMIFRQRIMTECNARLPGCLPPDDFGCCKLQLRG